MPILSSAPEHFVHMIRINNTDGDTKGLLGFWAEEPFFY